MSGPGVFSVAARANIKHQVTLLSVVSTLLITLMLLWVYRSFRALVLGLIPVASGALAGISAVALGFGSVHGITLGFGVTLIGESVDYSIYLFIQSQQTQLSPLVHHPPGRIDLHRRIHVVAAVGVSRPGSNWDCFPSAGSSPRRSLRATSSPI